MLRAGKMHSLCDFSPLNSNPHLTDDRAAQGDHRHQWGQLCSKHGVHYLALEIKGVSQAVVVVPALRRQRRADL